MATGSGALGLRRAEPRGSWQKYCQTGAETLINRGLSHKMETQRASAIEFGLETGSSRRLRHPHP